QLDSIAALGEPVRRALYRYVVAQSGTVSREQAAAGIGVPRHTAKFHLDRLESDGLLETEYRRPPGKSGPGAGRPTKLYRRADRDVEISLPPRRYDLAGYVMAEAITASGASGASIGDSLRTVARRTGHTLGSQARGSQGRSGTRLRRAAAAAAVTDVLGANGFEPCVDGDQITLANCPFHKLAQDYPDLVCAINLDLIGGLVDELGPKSMEATLDPAPGRCCVRLRKL
ncbi:MAG: helix-turn-helix domain-containing protein, partial [Jatrophihabitantaceae bacterium]